ncbi:hypothetical protein BRC93_03130 [Halobacteriales archaeon QS_5_70_15]|nr:MAG: hypothetical protein BRC93_03130 [Halobacteriales archaeon QS_5_70_15]
MIAGTSLRRSVSVAVRGLRSPQREQVLPGDRALLGYRGRLEFGLREDLVGELQDAEELRARGSEVRFGASPTTTRITIPNTSCGGQYMSYTPSVSNR